MHSLPEVTELGEIITGRRIALNISQSRLSKTVKISQSTLSIIEHGEREGSFLKIARILTALGLSLDEVYGIITESGRVSSETIGGSDSREAEGIRMDTPAAIADYYCHGLTDFSSRNGLGGIVFLQNDSDISSSSFIIG